MSKFFLGCRRKTYDICIRYGGRSKKTLFGNFDIEVFLRYRSQNCYIVIRYRRSISGYTDVEGKFLRCLIRHRIQHRDIRMSKYDFSDVAPICKPAFPPPAAGRISHVPAGNLNMTRNLKFSSCPGSHHPLLFFRLHNISQVFSQLAKSNLLVMQVWWSGLSSRAAGLRLTVSGPYGHRLAELEI